MMKKGLTIFFACCLALVVSAQVEDAFHGILPVTDPAKRMSLNGEWRLKVIEGVSENRSVPALDASWGNIPVPELPR